MSVLDDIARLQRVAEEARAEAARAEGAGEAALARLREEFGCNSLDEAGVLLRRLGKKAERAERAFRVALAEYEAKYGNG